MNPTVSAYAEDLDADGVEELVLVNAGNMFVFSPDSGDIIAWYDLANGLLMAGSGLTPRETVGGALVASGTLRSDGFTFEIGQDSKSLTFRSSSGPAFVTKAFRLEGSALKATFDIRATGSVDLTLSSFVRLSRALDVVAGTDLLAYRDPGGKGVLSAYTHGGTPLGLMSMATGAYAVVRYDGLAAEVSCTSVPFGRLVATDYALSLAPGASATVSMELESGVERITAHPIHELRRDGESIVAVVPSYTVACALRYSNLGITVSADMAAGDKAGELRAPMPEGRFTMVSQYAWGPGPIIEDAGARLEGAGSYSFFPKVEDARVTIHQGAAQGQGSRVAVAGPRSCAGGGRRAGCHRGRAAQARINVRFGATITLRPGHQVAALSCAGGGAMRVLMFSWEYPPRVVGGLSRHVQELGRAMAAEHEVHVIALGDRESDESDRGVHVHRVDVPGPRCEDFLQWSSAAHGGHAVGRRPPGVRDRSLRRRARPRLDVGVRRSGDEARLQDPADSHHPRHGVRAQLRPAHTHAATHLRHRMVPGLRGLAGDRVLPSHADRTDERVPESPATRSKSSPTASCPASSQRAMCQEARWGSIPAMK